MTSEGERLQKVLARAGLGSRRSIEEQILKGRITVNGRKAILGARVDPSRDVVEVDGSRVQLAADAIYYLLNKPVGVVTSAADEQGRTTVLDLVDPGVRVWPVGRLDVDTEGALLLTNDGELTNRITHPRYEVPKTYVAEVGGSVGPRVQRHLARGVRLEDGMTKRAEVSLLERVPGGSLVEITLAEGKHRQVRRMFEAVGHPVRRLVRTAIGPLMLGRLKPGTLRRLSPEEVRSLFRASGL
jgi:23S rRNA pseudouridine2605 synthase